MKDKLLIIVEGIADKTFLEQYIGYKFSYVPYDIIINGGGNCIIGASIIQMNKNVDDGGKNIVIFDADNDFHARSSIVDSWKKKVPDFDFFLFPNGKDSGCLETILENIINQNNNAIFSCWRDYELCLGGINIVGRTTHLTLPAIKTKIYAYLEALLGSSNREKDMIKESKRVYTNKDFWDLDSDYLKPLYDFLLPYFNP